jgi:hypothetical protein
MRTVFFSWTALIVVGLVYMLVIGFSDLLS